MPTKKVIVAAAAAVAVAVLVTVASSSGLAKSSAGREVPGNAQYQPALAAAQPSTWGEFN